MLKRTVNGIVIELSPAEEAAKRAEWAEESRPRTPQELSDIADQIVEGEFSPILISVIKTIAAITKDGSINLMTPEQVVSQVKLNRKSEVI